jgi:hypothetical protein
MILITNMGWSLINDSFCLSHKLNKSLDIELIQQEVRTY